MSGSKLLVADLVPLHEKLEKHLDGWKDKSSSIGGRYVLIQSALCGVPIYHMSMYLLPDTNIEKMSKVIRKFFWQGNATKKKYYMVKWNLITKPKRKGGLGLKNMKLLNVSLLCKWWWRLESEEGLWQEVVKKKYGIEHGIWRIARRQNDSAIWKDLLKVKHIYLQGRVMMVNSGECTDFWHDAWCGGKPFSELYPILWFFCQQQKCTVKEIHDRGWNLTIHGWLDPELQRQLSRLRSMLTSVALSSGRDTPRWKFTKSGKFSVKSLYEKLSSVGPYRSFKQLWKAKIPLKIKIWLWLIWHNAIATKDNMKKRKWVGDVSCRFCPANETISHLFFDCPAAVYMWSVIGASLGAHTRPVCFTHFFSWIAKFFPFGSNLHIVGIAAFCWAIWKTRNRACFEKRFISSPVELICYMCAFLRYWAGMQTEATRAVVEDGAAKIQQTALRGQELANAGRAPRIQEIEEDKNDGQ